MAPERIHVFLLLRRGGKPERVVVWDTQDITVGREPENDVVVNDPEVSRGHARLRKEGAAFLVDNLSRSNPTYVNGEAVTTKDLQHRDVVGIGESQLIFYRTTENPVTLGLATEYASQLKGFGPKVSGDGEATVLGLMDTLPGPDAMDEFQVRPAGDFDHELAGMNAPPLPRDLAGAPDDLASASAPPLSRDLDLEIGGGLEELELPPPQAAPAAPESWSLEDEPAEAGSFSFTVEVEGLGPEQRALLGGLLGKVIALPKLRIRLKGEDLG